MSKIKIKAELKQNNQTKTYETNGIFREDTITYYEEKTLVKIEKKQKDIILIRRNDELHLKFIFDKDPMLIITTKEGIFNIPIEIKQKKWDKSEILLEYKIEENIRFKLIWEEEK